MVSRFVNYKNEAFWICHCSDSRLWLDSSPWHQQLRLMGIVVFRAVCHAKMTNETWFLRNKVKIIERNMIVSLSRRVLSKPKEAKSNTNFTPIIWIQSLTDQCLFNAVGENVKEFFFRVASLAFETNVLAELEKSGSRQIGDVVSEYPNRSLCNHDNRRIWHAV